jgi:formylglycine-generating enzyme required for sulfatase activity
MGDPYAEGFEKERPVHTVYVSAFFMDKYEVTSNLWREVYTWALANGYGFDNSGLASGTNHPIRRVNWYDCIKWCNARSQKEGLTPVYCTSSAMTSIYTNGQVDITNACVNWGGNGYRLPTEAEWEKAARGGLPGHHFPWNSSGGTYADHVDGSKANYIDSGDPYDNDTTPVAYYDGNQVPAGINMVNGYGLYDMAGNVAEWCWEWERSDWYSDPAASQNDARGPAGPRTFRVIRDGAYSLGTSDLRSASRNYGYAVNPFFGLGFRCVRGLP